MLRNCVVRSMRHLVFAATQSQNCMQPPNERHGAKITCFFRLPWSNMTIQNEWNCKCDAEMAKSEYNVIELLGIFRHWQMSRFIFFFHLNVISITNTPPPAITFGAAFDHRISPEVFLCFFLPFCLIFHFTIRLLPIHMRIFFSFV